MLQNLSLIILTAAFSFSNPSYASCEKQRLDLQEWTQKCDRLTQISEISTTVGGLLAVPTHGLSLAPCAAACVTSEIACQFKASLAKDLQECERREENESQQPQVHTTLSTHNPSENDFYKIYLLKNEQAQAQYEAQLLTLIEQYADEDETLPSPLRENFSEAVRRLRPSYRQALHHLEP